MLKRWLKKKLSPLFRNSWVLMYHRVDDPLVDPWNNAVTKEKFEEQLHWLKRQRNVQSLTGLVNDWKQSKLKGRSIAITFDDGYLDNYTTVVPLLEKYELPATFFICTQPLFNQQSYWWDQLQVSILENPLLPQFFSVGIGQEQVEMDLTGEEVLTKDLQEKIRQWRYPAPPNTKRGELYLKLWQELRKKEEKERNAVMNELRSYNEHVPTPLKTVTVDQLIKWNNHPLIDIGAHSVSHPPFQFLSPGDQLMEMKACKDSLECLLNTNVRHFAFPYGSYSSESFSLAKQVGYEAAFVTQNIPVNKAPNAYFFGRVMMTNEINYPLHLR